MLVFYGLSKLHKAKCFSFFFRQIKGMQEKNLESLILGWPESSGFSVKMVWKSPNALFGQLNTFPSYGHLTRAWENSKGKFWAAFLGLTEGRLLWLQNCATLRSLAGQSCVFLLCPKTSFLKSVSLSLFLPKSYTS